MGRTPARSKVRKALAVSIAGMSLVASAARADCQLARIVEVSVSEEHPHPTIPALVNGHEERFLVDSGALDNMISAQLAAQLKLQTYYPANAGARRRGVPASKPIEIARVKELKVAGLTIKDGELSVIRGEPMGDGVLGQNVLRHFAVEYDFGDAMMRLFTSSGCEGAKFAYWLKPDQHYTSMAIGLVDAANPYTVGDAYIDGHRIRVAFDSGMTRSLLTREVAERLGAKFNSKDVAEIGLTKRLGWDPVKTYLARFKTFKIGDGEQIFNIQIPVGDFKLKSVDMLLGADFFMAHRIIVGNKEERVLMSYEGGPVFDTSSDTENRP